MYLHLFSFKTPILYEKLYINLLDFSFGIFLMDLVIFSLNSACVNLSNFCNRDIMYI